MPKSSPQQNSHLSRSTTFFPGFAAPTSNTTFTPNQFFDVCLRYNSRGVVRLVAYLIRQTLGWCDANGNPLHERVRVSYRELVDKAGISRGLIRKSLDEAIGSHFIECVQSGKAATAYSKGENAHYQLRWDSRSEYIKDPTDFRGFFEGEGNRTDIPNQFFDCVIPNEPLSIIKVVGSIIRFSIGFQARRGRRRQQVQLSYRDIERYARIRDTHTLAAAIRYAEQSRYIMRIQEGIFDPNGGENSRAAVYTLRWADSSPYFPTGSKSPAVISADDQFENPSGTGSEIPAVNQFEIHSDIETKQRKETSKQQHGAADTRQAYALLREQGFAEKAANLLASRFPQSEIRQQVEWLSKRAPSYNRLGMLRRAIEENWSEPDELRHAEVSEARDFARSFYAELGGNSGTPVADASKRDIEVAERLIWRLHERSKVNVELNDLAREFANYVAERKRHTDIPSLVLALRLYGDMWLTRFAGNAQHEREQKKAATRRAHRQKWENAWLRFISEAEKTCRINKADAYSAFLQQFQSSPWRSTAVDEERLRLLEFRRQFQLPDFWQWDAEFNDDSFKCE
jgi:hypothetical protein